MVDFKRLKAESEQPAPVDPVEIFRRLPKAEGINDLCTSQAQVWKHGSSDVRSAICYKVAHGRREDACWVTDRADRAVDLE